MIWPFGRASASRVRNQLLQILKSDFQSTSDDRTLHSPEVNQTTHSRLEDLVKWLNASADGWKLYGRSFRVTTSELIRKYPDLDLGYFWLAAFWYQGKDKPLRALDVLHEGLIRSRRKGELCALIAEIGFDRDDFCLLVEAAIRAVEFGTDLWFSHHVLSQLFAKLGMAKVSKAVLSGVPTELIDSYIEKIHRLATADKMAEVQRSLDDFCDRMRYSAK